MNSNTFFHNHNGKTIKLLSENISYIIEGAVQALFLKIIYDAKLAPNIMQNLSKKNKKNKQLLHQCTKLVQMRCHKLSSGTKMHKCLVGISSNFMT